MTDLFPLNELDEAVRAYLDACNPEHGALGGWVLVWQEQRIIAEPGFLPLATSNDVMLSPTTTAETAAGLLRAGTIAFDRILDGDYGDDEE